MVVPAMGGSMWADGFIAVDWGTTNRRAYLLDGSGSCTREFEDGKGIMSAEAGGPMLEGVGAVACAAGKTADDTYEIIDGVRRAKAAEKLGHKTIPGKIFDEWGNEIGRTDIPIDKLRSPKDFIEVDKQVHMDRWTKTWEQTKAGSTPPPIEVTPGSKGTPIKDVGFGPGGGRP